MEFETTNGQLHCHAIISLEEKTTKCISLMKMLCFIYENNLVPDNNVSATNLEDFGLSINDTNKGGNLVKTTVQVHGNKEDDTHNCLPKNLKGPTRRDFEN